MELTRHDAFLVIAQDRLMSSVRDALPYALTVAAQYHARLLLCVHAWREELCVALVTALEAHSLAQHSASFAEHFYGLRRAHLGPNQPADTRSSRLLELALLVFPAYIRARLESPLAPWAAPEGVDDREGSPEEAPTTEPTAELAPHSHRSQAIRVAGMSIRVSLSLLDALQLLQLLRFCFGRSRHCSLSHLLLGATLRRYSEPRRPTPQPKQALGAAARMLSYLELPLQHARQLLLLSIFGYRLLEWWHSPEHAPQQAPLAIPPPPPPPPLPPNVRLPAPGTCAMCGTEAVKPTATPSGYVFCEKCITPAVRRDGKCQVTQLPATVPELLRLYETSLPPR